GRDAVEWRAMLFIFDMDNVLFRYDWRVRRKGLSELSGLDFFELRRRWWHDDGEWAAEAGAWPTAAAYLEAFSNAIEVRLSPEQWLANRRSAMQLVPEALSAVARARELGEVTLLTNNNPMVAENLAELAPELVPLFGEHLHASCEYGARKPDPLVFLRVLDQYLVDAPEAFFADDMAANVRAARSVGITAHHVTGERPGPGMLAAIEQFAASRARSVG
ncbi:MAG: HAD-IA family hydrolase, partial [Microbacteriaceae bacterium]